MSLKGRKIPFRPKLTNRDQQVLATFVHVAEFGNRFALASKPTRTIVTLEYPDTPRVRQALGNNRPKVSAIGPENEPGLKITAIEFDTLHLSLVAAADAGR